MKRDELIADLFSYLVLLTLLVLSIVHFKERIIHLDSAGFVFDMINNSFEVLTYRISSWVPLIIISFLSYFKVPLENILLISSIIYALYPIVTYLILRYRYQISFQSILIPLIATIGTISTFYYPVTEVFFGIYLFAAIFLIGLQNKWIGIDKHICYFLLPLSHPFFIPIGIGLLLNKSIFQRRIEQGAWAFLLGLILALSFSTSSSESVFYTELFEFKERYVFWYTPPFEFLVGHLGTYSLKYLVLLLFFVGFIVFSIINRKIFVRESLWIIPTCAVYFTLIGIIYYEGESSLILEKSILPVALLVACGVVVAIPKKWWSLLFVFLLVMWQIREIALQIKNEHKRMNAIAELVDLARENDGSKFLKKESLISSDILIPWALSVETLLYSSLYHGQQVTICPSFEGAELETKDGLNKFYLYPYFLEMDENELNRAYFQISGTYKLLE